jgi:hypothetical protein
MKKYVVYSAIIGQYDIVLQPEVIDERFDYIMFSDSMENRKEGIWEIRRINYRNAIPTKTARWVKTHPEVLLPEYVASTWIDASVLITSNYIYERTISLYENNALIATHVHPERNCIYNEMFGMLVFQWEQEDIILKWGQKLRKELYPREIGTFETRVLYRSHMSPAIVELDNFWWDCINEYSRRDQLSFNYCLWKLNIHCQSFLPLNCSVHNSEHFQINNHINSAKKRVGRPSWLIRYYYKHPNSNIENVYYWIYGRVYPKLWSLILGQYFRFKHLVNYVFS